MKRIYSIKKLTYFEQCTWNGMKDKPIPIDFSTCPNDYMASGFKLYFEKGYSPGSFGKALLIGNLYDAYDRADFTNKRIFSELVEWVFNELPYCCWEGEEKVNQWIADGGVGDRLDWDQ